MRNKKSFFFLFFSLFMQTTYAYIDPGTGSYIIQILIAGGLAGLYATKTYWKNINTFVKKLFKKK